MQNEDLIKILSQLFFRAQNQMRKGNTNENARYKRLLKRSVCKKFKCSYNMNGVSKTYDHA